MTPLLFDPDESWEYGSSMDWCGQIVEAITGKRLGDVFESEIFAPLGIQDMAFEPTGAMLERLVQIYDFDAKEETFRPTAIEVPTHPELHMGGHGLYGTVDGYIRFIRMWLNDGMGEGGQVLKPETVAMAAKDHLGGKKLPPFEGVIPALSNDAEFFPGQSKSWALSLMVNDEEAPTGRPAGSLGWAGLANLFYWIDRRNGCGGVWATQIFPFGNPASFGGYMALETEYYRCSGY
jgi:methyl acetate hydrolase